MSEFEANMFPDKDWGYVYSMKNNLVEIFGTYNMKSKYYFYTPDGKNIF